MKTGCLMGCGWCQHSPSCEQLDAIMARLERDRAISPLVAGLILTAMGRIAAERRGQRPNEPRDEE